MLIREMSTADAVTGRTVLALDVAVLEHAWGRLAPSIECWPGFLTEAAGARSCGPVGPRCIGACNGIVGRSDAVIKSSRRQRRIDETKTGTDEREGPGLEAGAAPP